MPALRYLHAAVQGFPFGYPSAMPLPPRNVAALFAPLHAELMALLRGLLNDDWQRPTVAPRWRVRDVVAHLLDTQLRKLAMHRDGHLAPVGGATTVLDLINTLNSGGVAFAQRLSPRLLVDLHGVVGPWSAAFIEALDPDAEALFPVAWAGEERSAVWMDTGREYTEWWHHQMQIRDAVGSGAVLLERQWLDPLLDFSVRALPFTYAGVEGRSVKLHIGADAWTLTGANGVWDIRAGAATDAEATIEMTPDTAWRLFYNALPPAQAGERITASGERRLLEPLLKTRSVMV
jgi:uncharacterized protein (TIGR03083 family)